MLSLHSLLLGSILGYFIGSIPSAYLVTKWKTGQDLRRLGSRNIGARNAFEVTGNRSIGAIVLVADLLKGLIPILAFELEGWLAPIPVLVPALVLGHCYPVWLRFHGGRGLATSAGALALVNPAAVAVWILFYGLTKKLMPTDKWDGFDVHFASILASGGVLTLLLIVPHPLLEMTSLSMSGLAGNSGAVQISVGIVVLIILSRHIEPVIQMLRERTT